MTLALAAALLLAGSAAAQSAAHQQKVSRQFAASSGLVVELENLAGTVSVSGGGDEVSVDATIHAESQQLAEQLVLEFKEQGNRLVVRARYPVERYDTYYYPARSDSGGSDSGLFGGSSRSTTRYLGQRVTVVSRPKAGAVLLYADFDVRLPAGVGARVENVAGDIEASGVDGPLSCDTGSGAIRSSGGSGRFSADTGSGDVEVRDHRGDVSVDTGSGDVLLAAIAGNVETDTGSGDIEMEDVDAETVDADTGSGVIRMRGVRGEITTDTGSGSIEGRGLIAIGRLEADTGSGGIDLEGDFSAVDSISIDAGSGGVTLAGNLPAMDLEISTGSRGIDVDLPGLEILEKDKDYLEARYQGGGVDVSIDTGSGRVRVSP